MTCIHITEAKTKIEVLINSGAIETKIGPFLTISEAESIISPNRVFSGDSNEIRNIAKQYPVIDRKIMEENLKEIRTLLSQCNCLTKAKESEEQKLEDEKRKTRQKDKELSDVQSELSLIQNENERFKNSIANLGGNLTKFEKKDKEENLDSKKENLADLMEKIEEKGVAKEGWEKGVRNLESLYQQLTVANHEKDRAEAKELNKKIFEAKSVLDEKKK